MAPSRTAVRRPSCPCPATSKRVPADPTPTTAAPAMCLTAAPQRGGTEGASCAPPFAYPYSCHWLRLANCDGLRFGGCCERGQVVVKFHRTDDREPPAGCGFHIKLPHHSPVLHIVCACGGQAAQQLQSSHPITINTRSSM